MNNAPPAHDAASEGSITGTLLEVYRQFLKGTDDMLPARIISYDRSQNTAVVQPLIRVLTTSGELVSRQAVPGVKVFQFGGGGFFMGFNLLPGDLGWIKAADRDISLFLQSYAESGPNTLRLHNFSDALFFPDVMRGYTIAEEDAGNMVLQNTDGSVRVSLWPDRVKVTAPLVEIDSPSVTMSGALAVAGPITSDTEVSVGPIALTTHLTSGVQAGDNTSGVPVP